MVYKSFLCSIGQSTYCVLDRFRLNGSFYIGRFTTKREAFELSKERYFSTLQGTTKTNQENNFQMVDWPHSPWYNKHNSIPTHFHNNSGTYTQHERACSNTSACAQVEVIRYIITTSIFSFFEFVHSFLTINLCIYCDDVYNECFYVNVITVNTKVDPELYKHYFHVEVRSRSFSSILSYQPKFYLQCSLLYMLLTYWSEVAMTYSTFLNNKYWNRKI